MLHWSPYQISNFPHFLPYLSLPNTAYPFLLLSTLNAPLDSLSNLIFLSSLFPTLFLTCLSPNTAVPSPCEALGRGKGSWVSRWTWSCADRQTSWPRLVRCSGPLRRAEGDAATPPRLRGTGNTAASHSASRNSVRNSKWRTFLLTRVSSLTSLIGFARRVLCRDGAWYASPVLIEGKLTRHSAWTAYSLGVLSLFFCIIMYYHVYLSLTAVSMDSFSNNHSYHNKC